MFKYIKCVVSVDNLRTQQGDGLDEDTFEAIINIDPTADYETGRGGKYCPWLFRQYKQGNLDIISDGQNLNDALGFFAKNGKKYPKSDLGQYKTVQEFLSDTETVGNMPMTEREKQKQLKKAAHNASDSDKEFLCEDSDFEVWQPLTYAGSISLARFGGTKATWCTAYEGNDYYWKRYSSQGSLYIFLNKHNPSEKYQLHIESNSWFDIEDRSLGMGNFYKFCKEHPIISKYFEVENYNGLQTLRGTLVSIDPDLTEVVIPPEIKSISRDAHIPQNCSVFRVLSSELKTLPYFSWQAERKLNLIDFEYASEDLLKKLRDEFGTIPTTILPSNLTTLPREFLAQNTKFDFDSLVIPNTLEKIGVGAFANCGISQIDLSNTQVTTISPGCFYKDSDLTSVTLPATVSHIRQQAFFDDNNLLEINLDNVTKIAAEAFCKCRSLQNVTLNPNVTIGSKAFASSGILNVTITNGMTIQDDAFDDCSDLVVTWNADDSDYDFNGIKTLICSKNCTKLIESNRDFVDIQFMEDNSDEV